MEDVTSSLTKLAGAVPIDGLEFHHVQMYVDTLRPLAEYQEMEQSMNKFNSVLFGAEGKSEDELAKLWPTLGGSAVDFSPSGQDIVDQMIHGLGWRIIGHHSGSTSDSVLISSKDDKGVKFIITARTSDDERQSKRQKAVEEFGHFSGEKVEQFMTSHNGRQGIAVLGFEVPEGGVDKILERYASKHPKLLVTESPLDYPDFKVIEVYAYYKGDVGASDVDKGTVMRFVERAAEAKSFLPGIEAVDGVFPPVIVCPAYFDHWVSNVISRTGFLDTLYDTLGFTPKVDFNAGVVAAGEAQIESTVTGNVSHFKTADKKLGLVNQSQVYLPINNALTEVGHVHLYLKEIGQGVQHLANRVENLPRFVANVNKTRRTTGHGFTFLKIPRTYYGRLSVKRMCTYDSDVNFGLRTPITDNLAKAVFEALKDLKLMNALGVVNLGITRSDIERLGPSIPPTLQSEFGERLSDIAVQVVRSQYCNLYQLLGDHVSEETYMQIVENNVLVDIQGDDILYQIFTSMVLQRVEGEEAPFLEFIQRVCSEKKGADGAPKKIVPGCGGFGIRNFLTLFCSIEIGKAAAELEEALKSKNSEAIKAAENKVNLFVGQLEESNPVLTSITDAMTAEGRALDDYEAAEEEAEKAAAKERFDKWKAVKEKGNETLKEISKRYADEMKALRTAQQAK